MFTRPVGPIDLQGASDVHTVGFRDVRWASRHDLVGTHACRPTTREMLEGYQLAATVISALPEQVEQESQDTRIRAGQYGRIRSARHQLFHDRLGVKWAGFHADSSLDYEIGQMDAQGHCFQTGFAQFSAHERPATREIRIQVDLSAGAAFPTVEVLGQ